MLFCLPAAYCLTVQYHAADYPQFEGGYASGTDADEYVLSFEIDDGSPLMGSDVHILIRDFAGNFLVLRIVYGADGRY